MKTYIFLFVLSVHFFSCDTMNFGSSSSQAVLNNAIGTNVSDVYQYYGSPLYVSTDGASGFIYTFGELQQSQGFNLYGVYYPPTRFWNCLIIYTDASKIIYKIRQERKYSIP